MKYVCLWSGPRNVSTALMYSFAQRPDTLVIDEPLYGHYLKISGIEHPGRDEVMAAMNCDGDEVMRRLFEPGCSPDKTLVFVKQMAHHLVDLDRGFIARTNNVFLVRDPVDMLPSLTVQLPDATLADTGLEIQWQLVQELQANGQSPVVIDSRELLLDPDCVLNKVCDALDVPFHDDMLSWQAGAREEDGIWAKYWYDSVHKSTGFNEYRPKRNFPEPLRGLLDECRPFYDKLYALAIRGAGR